MTAILINADDFGLSDGICEAIELLFEAGAISSTSVMMAVEGAAERVKASSLRLWIGRVGVHLQLTSGQCVAEPEAVPSLLTVGSRRFRNPREGELPKVDEVEIEWRAQIAKFIETVGVNPSHLDTHHGVHRIPEYYELFLTLASEFGCRVRGGEGCSKYLMRKRGVCGTNAIVRDWTGKGLDCSELLRRVRAVSARFPDEEFVEIVTHPGFSDGYLRSVSSLSDMREGDFSALMGLSELSCCERSDIQLVTCL